MGESNEELRDESTAREEKWRETAADAVGGAIPDLPAGIGQGSHPGTKKPAADADDEGG
jgi:hypothetical protein